MPFLLPQDAVVIVNGMVILTIGLTVAETWRRLHLGETCPVVVADLPPVPVGVFLLHEFNPTALRVIIAVVVLTVGLMSLFSVRLPGARRRGMAPVIGSATTLMVTTFGVGAPLAALYSIEQDWSRDTIRATLALYFLMAAVFGMILFAVTGLVSIGVAQNIGVLAVAVLAVSGVAAVIARRIQPANLSLCGGGGDGRWERIAAGEGGDAGSAGHPDLVGPRANDDLSLEGGNAT